MSDHGSTTGPAGGHPAQVTWLIEQFASEVAGVTHAVVVSLDGLQLAAAGDVDRDLGDQLAALTAGLLSIAGQYGEWLQVGSPENMTIRFPRGHLAFMRVGDAAGLCVAARPGTDMRALAFRMSQFVQAVGHALTPEIRRQLHQGTVARATG